MTGNVGLIKHATVGECPPQAGSAVEMWTFVRSGPGSRMCCMVSFLFPPWRPDVTLGSSYMLIPWFGLPDALPAAADASTFIQTSEDSFFPVSSKTLNLQGRREEQRFSQTHTSEPALEIQLC